MPPRLESSKRSWQRLYAGLIAAAVCILTVLGCLASYTWDNKYTAAGPQGSAGLLTLTEADLAANPVMPLVSGWEYYGGKLLTPADFDAAAPTPDRTIFIGQYGGFDNGDRSASPHGSATYRLVIDLPQRQSQYLLELPEIFSAYRAWINSEPVAHLGDPERATYRPETRNQTVQIAAAGQVEILIAVSDWSHVYSGMTYPPLFGTPAALSGVVTGRLILRAIVDAFALAVGALVLLVGIGSHRKPLALLYGLLCLCFISFTAYPLIKSLTGSFYPFYVIENLSFNAMLLTAVVLQGVILGRHGRWERGFVGFGALALAASVVLPFALQTHDLRVVAGYSTLVTAYQWATAALLTARAAVSLWRGRPSSLILAAGIVALDTTLVMDRLLPWHEPIITGWFYELGSFALVGCIGVVVARDLAATYRDNVLLAERMDSLERLGRLQERNYQLIEARITEAKAARHDLRHHLAAISGLVSSGQFRELATYVRSLTVPSPQPIEYSRNQVINALLGHFGALAEQAGVNLTVKLEVEASIAIPDPDLATILSNLLENALESCARIPDFGGNIGLVIIQKPSLLVIEMNNSAARPAPDGEFNSSKAARRRGYGLDSIRLVATRHDGDVDFTYDEATEVFHSTVLLPLGQG